MNATLTQLRTFAESVSMGNVKDSSIKGLRFGLTLVFTLMLVASLHPVARTSLRGILVPNQRVITSTLQADLMGDGTVFTIAKIKTRDSLLIEIYEALAEGKTKLVEQIELPNQKDGYFNFNGQATNLAVDDINNDGRLEILAPSFDHNLTGHVNIYSDDKDNKSFQKVLR